MTIKFPVAVSFSRADQVADGVPGDRAPQVRRESEDDKRVRLAASAREILQSQQLAGSHTVGHRRNSWEPMPAAVPAAQWDAEQRQRRETTEQIDWAQAEHGEQLPAPNEITVQKIPDQWEDRALKLSAEIDAFKAANFPGRP